MARRAQITDQTDDETDNEARIIDAEADDVSDRQNEIEREDDEILSEFNEWPDDAQITFKVFKASSRNSKGIHCFSGTKADFPIVERIQQECGGGTYTVYIYRTRNNKMVLWKKPTIEILELRKTDKPVMPSSDPNFAALVDLLKQQQMTRTEKKEMSLAEMLTAGAAVVTALVPIFQMMKSNGGSAKETLEMLATAKELFNSDADKEPKGLMDVAGEVLPQLIASMAGAQTQTRQLPSPQQQQTITPEQVKQAQAAQLQQQLRGLISRAQKNSPPELYADLLEDTLPPEYLLALKQPGAMEFLLTIEPAIGTYRMWFEAVLKSLIEGPMDESGDGGDHTQGDYVSQSRDPGVSVGYDARRPPGGAYDAEGDDSENQGG